MPVKTSSFPCWMVRETPAGVASGTEWLLERDLPVSDGPSVTIEVAYSSLNYKDALACRGHRGVVARFPHVPGIDCAGTVVASESPQWRPGQEVLVTGYGLGAAQWGGFSGLVRVPADWPVAIPPGFTTREAMLLGTAGFTATQCAMAIESRVAAGSGDVLVTGATGGVGVWAVTLLAKLGYRVVAATGKPQHAGLLRQLGAAEVVGREAIAGDPAKPMLAERWAAAVDTVGGETLAAIVGSLRYRGVVAACGLVGGTDLRLTVYPFLLRGVTLAGIDSAKCPREPRLEVWRRLMGPWRVALPEELVTTLSLDGLAERVEAILAGQVVGRTLVVPESLATQSGGAG